ncbi:tyrosine-type recombinase/integrase [Salmonella enterica]|nr:integrase [Salmonella enterica]EEA1793919.1 tyrosine-type recombinase/integrase [Salmonella enterica subsp. enterica serovar Muenchen]EAW3718847.1 integrase [Salmonella enterica]EAX8010885.1 integrase [Salmonella enterica]EAY7312917.1 integrase [Salmonella enterica]
MRKYITDTEWHVFFNAITGSRTEHRDKAMFKMAYRHGLRVSELTGLRINDLDLSGKTIFIHRLKNGFSTIHPLQERTCDYLELWLEKRKKYISKYDNNWLFVSYNGERLTRQWIYKLSRKYSQQAGLNLTVHPHMLRHACGYALANQGLDTRLIQDYLGHRNIYHTVRYTASNPARFRNVWQ